MKISRRYFNKYALSLLSAPVFGYTPSRFNKSNYIIDNSTWKSDGLLNASGWIKVIGVGEIGTTILTTAIKHGLKCVHSIAINNDISHLSEFANVVNCQLEINRYQKPLLFDSNIFRNLIVPDYPVLDSNLVILIGCFCEKTNAPEVLDIAKSLKEFGATIIALNCVPSFSPKHCTHDMFLCNYSKLLEIVDTSITLPCHGACHASPNYRLTMQRSLAVKNLCTIIRNICDNITHPGFICIDFTDILWIFRHMGQANFSIGQASGHYRLINATSRALNGIKIKYRGNTKNIISMVVFRAHTDVSIDEVAEALKLVDNTELGNGDGIRHVIHDDMLDGTVQTLIVTNSTSVKQQKEVNIDILKPT